MLFREGSGHEAAPTCCGKVFPVIGRRFFRIEADAVVIYPVGLHSRMGRCDYFKKTAVVVLVDMTITGEEMKPLIDYLLKNEAEVTACKA